MIVEEWFLLEVGWGYVVWVRIGIGGELSIRY
jgi:hypothetical protein